MIILPRCLVGETGAPDRQKDRLARWGVSFKPKISIAANCIRQHKNSTLPISCPFVGEWTERYAAAE
jgi:hypothetical protein